MREATSPEVTDDEDETRRVAVPLVWESTRLRYLKRELDADYRDRLIIQARHQKATVLQSQTEFRRTAPPRNLPEWAQYPHKTTNASISLHGKRNILYLWKINLIF